MWTFEDLLTTNDPLPQLNDDNMPPTAGDSANISDDCNTENDILQIVDSKKRSTLWTTQEDEQLIQKARELGICYKGISNSFDGIRTPVSCKRRLYFLKRRSLLPADVVDKLDGNASMKPTKSDKTPAPVGVVYVEDKGKSATPKGTMFRCSLLRMS